MPYTSGTPRLFYRSEGQGPLVIMLHGLLMNGQCWVDNGFVQALAPYFHVICPDLSGHGLSDKPASEACYTRESQAAALVELIQELGHEKVHVIGYSAGAWLALGLLEFYPDRLHSVVVGGWDCLQGLPDTLSFDSFMAYARETAPELSSLSPEAERSAACFFNELKKRTPGDEKRLTRGIPLLFWAGFGDPYYAAMSEVAEQYAIPIISGKGDHLDEITHPDEATLAEILKFVG